MSKVPLSRFIITVCVFFPSVLPGQVNREVVTYLSPVPGAQFVSPEASIIMRFREGPTVRDIAVSVQGSLSGVHLGRIIRSDDLNTVLFDSDDPFLPGETVTATIRVHSNPIITFDFEISKRVVRQESLDNLYHEQMRTAPSKSRPAVTYQRPQTDYVLPIDFPQLAITALDNPEPGYIFVSNFSSGNTDPPNVSYLLILDNQGVPYFFRRLPTIGVDFKKQPNGLLTYFLVGQGFYAMDNTYTVVDTFRTGNGYITDSHDMQLLNNGHALLMSYDHQTIDMSQVIAGGDTAATVTGLIIQEIDSNKNVIFQWRSWDHFEITDASYANLTANRVDYAHGNAIELDHDGNLLISCRHMDEITKIDRQTGEIIWRLGGKNNQFTFTNDTDMFSYQHDMRRLPNGNITLFDNGNFHSPSYTRAVEYQLDEENMTATLVWEYRDPEYYSAFMGNAQRLPGGNTLIGWGGTNPTVTEVTPDGSKTFELTFIPDDIWSYRSFRFEWDGVAAAPYVWADTSGQELNLHFTKFGDSLVVEYRLYRGNTAGPGNLTLVDSTQANTIKIDGLTEGGTYFFRVTAVDAELNESAFSNRVEYTAPMATAIADPEGQPETYLLHANYPNPFNARTTISYFLPVASRVSVKILNVRGEEVATLVDRRKMAGNHSVVWDAKDSRGRSVASGLYFYKLSSDAFTKTGKMILMK